MSKTKAVLLAVGGLAIVLAAIYFLGFRALPVDTVGVEWFWKIAGSAITVLVALVFYELSSRAISAAMRRARGTEGEVKMFLGLWRLIVAFVAVLVIIGGFFELGILAAAFGAFGGMFLGWALQPLVSGFAAWLLVTLKRPFRAGDRVQLPAQGLVGDVSEVGPMHTVLNQVGGAVGIWQRTGIG